MAKMTDTELKEIAKDYEHMTSAR